jgi:tellurium resistance protein TerD
MIPGSNASLTAENPDLRKILVGFGWSLIPSRGPQAELVPLAIMCGHDGRALSDEHLVFFNQLTSPEGGLEFVESDDVEQIDVDLDNVPEAVRKIVFVVYVDPDLRGPGTFASVKHSYIRLANESSRELIRFDIPAAVWGALSPWGWLEVPCSRAGLSKWTLRRGHRLQRQFLTCRYREGRLVRTSHTSRGAGESFRQLPLSRRRFPSHPSLASGWTGRDQSPFRSHKVVAR